MKLSHLPEDMIEDFEIEVKPTNKYIEIKKDIKSSYSVQDIIDNELLNKLMNIVEGCNDNKVG